MSGVMLVTGGARGIGAAVCRRAGAAGFRVAVNYSRARDRALGVVRDLESKGVRAMAVQADVGDEHEVERMFTESEAELGPITALVNNAGIDYESAFADVQFERMDRVFRVNVYGTMIAAREAIRRMAVSRGGSGGVIVNIGSMSTVIGGTPGDLVYTATKGAIESFTRGLALEYGSDGVRVSCVRPGATHTDIFDNSKFGLEHVLEFVKQRVSLGRIAKPEEIAGLIVWLCSAEATYATGGIYDVSGGLL